MLKSPLNSYLDQQLRAKDFFQRSTMSLNKLKRYLLRFAKLPPVVPKQLEVTICDEETRLYTLTIPQRIFMTLEVRGVGANVTF